MSKAENLFHVVLEINDGAPQAFHQKSVIIGSGPAANLRVEGDSVSSIHAILKGGEDPRTALISDLGSEEGTRINGEEIRREAPIRKGDRIQVGKTELRVVSIGQAPVAEDEAMDRDETEEDEELSSKPEPCGEPYAEPQGQQSLPQGQRSLPKPEPRKTPPKLAPRKSTETRVVRNREIPRARELTAVPSGQNFFERALHPMERPYKGEKLLEVKVQWGPIVLDVRQFTDQEIVTVGDSEDATIRLTTDREGAGLYTLASPGGVAGHVVNVATGMEIDVRRGGKDHDVGNLPSAGAVRTYALGINDKVRIRTGHLAFVIQYVIPARGLSSNRLAGSDWRMTKWFGVFLVLTLGLWTAIQMTPKMENEVSDYLKNPARFAQLIMPQQKQNKKTFEEIKKKQDEKIKVEDDAKWKKVQSKVKKESTKEVPREVKQEQDRKIASNAGILKLLKNRGGGTGDNAASLFGGSAMTSLDQTLAGLQNQGMGDSMGFGGLGTRGGGPGGGGGLGLGGLGTHGYGRGGGEGYGSIKIGQRGKAGVRVAKGRTRVIGGLSQEVVGRYIKRYWAQFKYCYERELTKEPNLYGKITVNFTITGNGRISEAGVVQTSMNNANVEECVLRVIRRIRFPEPKGGGEVIVTYPFMFTTAG